MKELGIKTRTFLRGMYYDALVEAGKVKDILTEKHIKNARPRRRALKIGKRRTILLSRPLLVGGLGFKIGDKVSVAKRGDSIILRKTQ
jgi:hypothetical protein